MVWSAYETLYKRLMNINEDRCWPWGMASALMVIGVSNCIHMIPRHLVEHPDLFLEIAELPATGKQGTALMDTSDLMVTDVQIWANYLNLNLTLIVPTATQDIIQTIWSLGWECGFSQRYSGCYASLCLFAPLFSFAPCPYLCIPVPHAQIWLAPHHR